MPKRKPTRDEVTETVYDAARASHAQTGVWPHALILAGDVIDGSVWGTSDSPGACPGTRPEIVDGVCVSGMWQGAFGRSIVSGERPEKGVPGTLIFIGRDDRLPPGSIVPIAKPIPGRPKAAAQSA